MDLSLLASLLDPPILFFVFGLFAVLVGSNLEIPQQITKFLSLYVLMAIGFKGGVALATTGITQVVVFSLLAAAIMALALPWSYALLRLKLKPFDAAAVAATYGSVSAVTFIAAGRVSQPRRRGVRRPHDRRARGDGVARNHHGSGNRQHGAP